MGAARKAIMAASVVCVHAGDEYRNGRRDDATRSQPWRRTRAGFLQPRRRAGDEPTGRADLVHTGPPERAPVARRAHALWGPADLADLQGPLRQGALPRPT